MTGKPATSEDGQPATAGAGGDAAPGPESGAARPRARWGLLLGVAAAVLALDQLTKWWAVNTLDVRTIDVVWTLRLRLTLNHGSAFSLASGRGALISVAALVIVAVLLRSGRYATRAPTAVAIGLVLGGAIGNLLDRGFRPGHGFLGGGVVDFVDLQWWPVFNLADSAIVIGAILLFLVEWRDDEPPGDRQPA
jgi:signal peptidase II